VTLSSPTLFSLYAIFLLRAETLMRGERGSAGTTLQRGEESAILRERCIYKRQLTALPTYTSLVVSGSTCLIGLGI
jgi:hypothetical protein